MQRKSSAPVKNSSATKKGQYNFRIPKEIIRRIDEHAELETRTRSGQIVVALKEWLLMKDGSALQPRSTVPIQPAPHNHAQTYQPGPEEISRPARRHPNLIPQHVTEAVMSDEGEGWEGLDPKTALAGTKVTPAKKE